MRRQLRLYHPPVLPPHRAATVTPPLRHAPASLAAGAFEPLANEGLPPFAQGLYMINTLVGEAVDSTDFLNAIMVRPPRGGAADFLCVLGSFLLASCGGWPPRAVAAALCRGSCAASLQYAAPCCSRLLSCAQRMCSRLDVLPLSPCALRRCPTPHTTFPR